MNEARESRLIYYENILKIGVYQEYTADQHGRSYDPKYFQCGRPIAIFKVKLKPT